MAHYDWSNTVTTWHFNPENVRDPAIVFNDTSLPVGTAPSYVGTSYGFEPVNFAPSINAGSRATKWNTIPLDQFGLPPSAKVVILSGYVSTFDWTDHIYVWYRATGSAWDLSPLHDSAYHDAITAFVPVGHTPEGVPAIDIAWQLNNPTALARMNLILSGWAE